MQVNPIDPGLARVFFQILFLTQNLCQVCAPSGNEVSQLLKSLSKRPEILWLTPRSLEEIADNVRELGRATGCLHEAEELIAAGRARLEKAAAVTRKLSSRPRVFCMEWLDPVYCSGHWMPEMVRIAGGVDELSREGTDSVRIDWGNVLKWSPEVLIITPCGFNLDKVVELAPRLYDYPGWADLPAVQQGRVYAVDANSYFDRQSDGLLDLTMTLSPFISDTPKRKVCPKCAASFTFGPQKGRDRCWCDELPHIPLAASEDQGCLCPGCLSEAISNFSQPESDADRAPLPTKASEAAQPSLVEGEDYYCEGAMIVFTARYHLRHPALNTSI